jgi:hypothetical protein
MDAMTGWPIDKHHGANNCRWARPTFELAAPLWLDAEAYPWSCLREGAPRVLSTTDRCASCRGWEPCPTLPLAETRN